MGYDQGTNSLLGLTGTGLRILDDNTYLRQVLNKYKVNETQIQIEVSKLLPMINSWANGWLVEASYSGSIAKGTAISVGTGKGSDADIFISLKPNTPDTLENIYNTLFKAVTEAGFQARKQNVSIGVSTGTLDIDLVPARKQSSFGNDHSLYKSKSGSFVKTNVKQHIDYVQKSGRADVIKLIKIWKLLHNVEMPSMLLEYAVIDCLKGCSHDDLSGNFKKALAFLADGFGSQRYVDVSNTNNVISDEMTALEKLKLSQSARNKAVQDVKILVW